MRTLVRALFTLAFSILLIVPGHSLLASDMMKLTIKVVDERGKPVDRANVRVVFKQGRKVYNLKKIIHSWELKTAQDGTARIPAVPKGDILVQVSAPFYQTYGDTQTIEDDEHTVEVVLKSPQKQYSVHEDLKK
ncbi:MAG: carboxypeptidase-like regulatory domain-containing protein [Acidobacteriota bacterium]